MQDSLANALAAALEDGGWRAKARPEQLPPPGDWTGWIVSAGRGFGKTRTGAEWVIENVLNGSARTIALVAPTADDAKMVMTNGVAGIMTVSPPWARPTFESKQLTWPNGAVATLFTAEAPERLRGPQHDLAWCDEIGAWANAEVTWDMLMFGLRLGTRPRWLATTTPRPTPLLRKLYKSDDVVVTRGSTFDNAGNLAPSFLRTMKDKYENTRLGRQELHAEMLDDVEGALWTRAMIDESRVPPIPLGSGLNHSQ